MASDQAVTINALPPELLRQVFSLFDGPAPSSSRLNDQPDSCMLRDRDGPLKNISLVSKRWRTVALPMLFRHVLWTLEHCDHLLAKPSEDSDDLLDEIAILAFLRANDLARHVRSFAILVCHNVIPVLPPMPPPSGAAASVDCPSSQDVTTLDHGEAQHSYLGKIATMYNEDNNWLWDMLFSLVDPSRLTIIASPQTLARLLSCMVFVADADFFSTGEVLHILSLSRDSAPLRAPGSKAPSRAAAQPSQCCPGKRKHIPTALFTIRPWTRLHLNENSSIRVYSSYHYFDRRPPSILESLLGLGEEPNNTTLVPPTVTSLSYVAIFPLANHFRSLVHGLPRVEYIYIQLVPRNDILCDKDAMNHVHASDLWLERNSCYELVMRNVLLRSPSTPPVFADGDGTDSDDEDSDSQDGDNDTESQPPHPVNNWQFLRTFETGDSADREAWETAVELVEMSQRGWSVEREGLFVKGPVPTWESDSDDSAPDWFYD